MEKNKKIKNTHSQSNTTNSKKKKNEIKNSKKIEKKSQEEIKKDITPENNKQKFYYSYSMRVAVNLLLFLTLLIIGIFFLLRTFTVEEANVVNYSEISNLDYNVYLKPNNFYENQYLEKDMIYVANLIDKIKINFNYDFMIEKPIDLRFNYDVIAKLIIQDENAEKTFYEKTYNLLSTKTDDLTNDMHKAIKETITIDYEKYNKIANSFKTTYGLNTRSKLIVYFNIDKDITNKEQKNLSINNDSDSMIINIPLSEKAVDINLDYKDIKNESKVIDNSKLIMENIVYLLITIVVVNFAIVFMIKLIRLVTVTIKKKNIYDQYIKKILNEYDRLIVETTTPPIFNETNDEKIFEVKEFTELLDVRDNLKSPIMYYVVTPHEKCHFYIKDDNRTYITTIKRVDLEEKNEKK